MNEDEKINQDNEVVYKSDKFYNNLYTFFGRRYSAELNSINTTWKSSTLFTHIRDTINKTTLEAREILSLISDYDVNVDVTTTTSEISIITDVKSVQYSRSYSVTAKEYWMCNNVIRISKLTIDRAIKAYHTFVNDLVSICLMVYKTTNKASYIEVHSMRDIQGIVENAYKNRLGVKRLIPRFCCCGKENNWLVDDYVSCDRCYSESDSEDWSYRLKLDEELYSDLQKNGFVELEYSVDFDSEVTELLDSDGDVSSYTTSKVRDVLEGGIYVRRELIRRCREYSIGNLEYVKTLCSSIKWIRDRADKFETLVKSDTLDKEFLFELKVNLDRLEQVGFFELVEEYKDEYNKDYEDD